MFTKKMQFSSQKICGVKKMSSKTVKVSNISDYLFSSLLLLLKLLKQTATGFTMFNISSYFETNSKALACIILSLLLTACGSGGSSDEASSTAQNVDSNTNVETDIEETIDPVVISSQPQSIIVQAGNQTEFTVVATGGGQLRYQWSKNGVELNGETNSNLTFLNTQSSQAGPYAVVVTNEAGSVTSLSALLTVNNVPTIPTPPVVEEPVVEEPVVEEPVVEEPVVEEPVVEEPVVEEPVVEEPVVEEPVLSSVELSWDIPVLREDGSDLELYEINGYVIKYGTDASNLSSTINVDGPSYNSVVIDELDSGTYYFAIATVDSDGIQGSYSAQLEQDVL